jgi:hypothetical protein
MLRTRGCGAAATEQSGGRVPELRFTSEMRHGGDGAIRRLHAAAALRTRGWGVAATEQRIRREAAGNYKRLPNAVGPVSSSLDACDDSIS